MEGINDSDGEMEAAPELPEEASILQCVKGVINIFEAAREVDFQIIDRESMLPLFLDQRREQTLLHDQNILAVLHSIYDACIKDEVILYKLDRRTISGKIRKVDKVETTNEDAIVLD